MTVCRIGMGAEELAVTTFTCDAVAFDVSQMLLGRSCARLLQIDQPGLDGDASRTGVKSAAGEPSGDLPPAELLALSLGLGVEWSSWERISDRTAGAGGCLQHP
jgi:hypothetical protein